MLKADIRSRLMFGELLNVIAKVMSKIPLAKRSTPNQY